MQKSVRAFQGPIPDPETLAAYEKIVPGSADRILMMAEKQGEHRRNLESRGLDAQISDQKASRNEARMGQFFGFTIGLVAIGSGTYLALNDAQLVGGCFGTGGVIGLVAVFLKGRTPSSTNDNQADE